MNTDRKLFLDYDETMAQSLYAKDEKHADQLIDMYGEHWVGEKFQLHCSSGWGESSSWYVTFKREWTNDLLTFSRQLFGNDNVYILSTGTRDYVSACNHHLKLGFDPNTNIYAREDIQKYGRDGHPLFKETFNVLVDNLSYWDHSYGSSNKVRFLGKIPDTQFIHVLDFSIHTEPLDIADITENLKDDILKAFNL